MKRHPLKAFPLLVGLAALTLAYSASHEEGWVQMFDGKSFDGWKINENPESWSIKDGMIVAHGERSHLFYMKEMCTDCEFQAEVKVSKGGNSGMFFRTKLMSAWPDGYEAQVNASHTDWRRTGSLYGIVNISETLVPADTWWTQHIIVKGNHIIIKVNDKVAVDYVDQSNRHSSGHLALQAHDPGSIAHYRNLRMRKIK